ncbi:MAG TPA: hypothetical protein VF306_08720 [Pirellulales bacterium]
MASDNLAPPPRIRPWQWFVLAAAAPIALTARKLNLDLWHDEIYTVITFVARGPGFIVTDYSLANNHVFYSLVLWPFYRISDSDLMLRLPSLMFTIATLALVFRLALRRLGLVAAVLATTLLGLNQMFLIHTIQVRGYGLSMCLMAWLVDLALAPPGAPARRRLAVALVGAAFLYVMPTNLLFFVPLAAAALAERWRQDRRGTKRLAFDAAAWAGAGILALLAYLPIAAQIAEVSRRSPRGSWGNVATLAGNFFSPALRDLWWLAPVAAAGMLGWTCCARSAEQRRGAAVPLLAGAVVCGAFLLSGALRISPFERNYCPLLPLLALAAGWSLAGLAYAVRRRWPSIPDELMALAGWALIGLALAPALITYPRRLDERRRQVAAYSRWPVQDGYYNYYAADFRPSELAAWLADQHIERRAYVICYAKEDHLDVAYALEHIALPIYHGLPRNPSERPVEVFAVLPADCPWDRLAERCGLTRDDVRHFEHLGDFGYHQLYRSRRPLQVGLPADNGPGE